MKIHYYFSSFCIVLVAVLSGCVKYPEYKITNPPSVNETSLELYVGDKKQVTANPVGASYKWTSKNEEVAKVSQTGLVEATGEGFTSVVVESDDDQTTIDVRVRTFIPLTGITLSPPKNPWYGEDEQESLFALPEPADATESIVWTSSNPNVATVSKRGLFTALAQGSTTVTASNASGTVSQSVSITVFGELSALNKTGWTVLGVSSYLAGGGEKELMIDNNRSTRWHTYVQGPGPWPFGPPHWALIDLGSQTSIARLEIHRAPAAVGWINDKTIICYASNIDPATYLNPDPPAANIGSYLFGPSPDPSIWQELGTVNFPNTANSGDMQLLNISPTPVQYLLFWIPDWWRTDGYQCGDIAEVNAYN
ncbi:hypothetical protein FACS1894177_00310 [Bacteroidia bacterium]|nr:hypothetical protein FACS1894177_00310 [Bacteroidia bacterium]